MAFLDKWEEELNDFVKKHYQSFFSKYKFELMKKEAQQGGGRMIFTDSSVVVEITNNQNRFLIKVGNMEGKLFWGLDLLKAYFKITDYRIDEDNISARKSALLGGFNADDHSGNATYLATNFNKIKDLFTSGNYPSTKEQLVKLDQEKQTFV